MAAELSTQGVDTSDTQRSIYPVARAVQDRRPDFGVHNASSGEQPIRVRIGLHTGEAIKDADKFFGRAVIMACRLADQAETTEILVSSDVGDALEEGGFSFAARRTLALKGFSGVHPAYTVSWQ